MTDFLPDYHYLPVRDGYVATYKLFADKPFRMIPGKETFATAYQAIEAAKAYVRQRINSKITSERIEQAAELSEFDAWRRAKAENEQAERERVFGAMPRQIVRNCAGNEVKVERRKVRA